MASEDARYRESTQYRLWSFTPSQLAAQRAKTNAQARQSISQRILAAASSSTSRAASTNNTQDSEPSSSSHRDAAATAAQLPEFLTPAEESTLLSFWISELIRAGEHVVTTPEIRATAAVFFKRFYVTNSIMTYPPADMLLVALFFGSKAEGRFWSAGQFAKDFGKESPDEVLAGEFLLCQGIRFAFDVKHPYRALDGAVMELRRYGDLADERITKAHRRARDILKWSPLITDAYFHYTPSQIMLAALLMADRGLCERIIQETFQQAQDAALDLAPTQGGRKARDGEHTSQILGTGVRQKVVATIEECGEMMAREPPERREYWANKDVTYKTILQPLNKKLRKCRDPDRSNLAILQRTLREQACAQKAADDSDDEDVGTLQDDGAVFGDPVSVQSGEHEAKRRKVGGSKGGDENVFGGPI